VIIVSVSKPLLLIDISCVEIVYLDTGVLVN
jgi:hypothetical protein